MNQKFKIRIFIDLLMTVLLILLMSYQITGQKLHEWIGTIMLILFVAHTILNIGWYKILFKGRYNSIRVFRTIINFALLLCVLALGYSGIVMSGYVFRFLNINNGMMFARTLHLSASYWGFILMSVHIGLHWGMVTEMINKFQKDKKIFAVLVPFLQICAVVIALYGMYCFFKNKIISYLFFQNHFIIFDFEKSGISVIIEYIAVMSLWIFIGYCITKALQKHSILKS